MNKELLKALERIKKTYTCKAHEFRNDDIDFLRDNVRDFQFLSLISSVVKHYDYDDYQNWTTTFKTLKAIINERKWPMGIYYDSKFFRFCRETDGSERFVECQQGRDCFEFEIELKDWEYITWRFAKKEWESSKINLVALLLKEHEEIKKRFVRIIGVSIPKGAFKEELK